MGLFTRNKTAKTAPVAVLGAPDRDLSHLSGDYTIDPAHSRIGFAVRHAMVTNVRGQFAEYSGALHIDGTNPAKSTAELVIKVASVDTGNAQRDEHLRTGDFFEANAHPEITFRSTAAEQVGESTYRLSGDLTVKDTTQQVTLDLEFSGDAIDVYGANRIGFEGGTTIDRRDWGLTYNAALETGGVLIGEKVKLILDISAVKDA
ncbi:YceI family protein [Streptacidiphilus anmyonensis]|uniref:YceI family protein n=1 Tax=Streptacidiphilus anmyonensis TaxID=405782 RepID=UPI0005A92827|nr:YceI family protein [Streptacidiphilus anmyonensis]